MKKYINFGLLLLVISVQFISGCMINYHELNLKDRNPTSFVFNFPSLEVRSKLKAKWQNVSSKYITFADGPSFAWGDKIFDKPENRNDAYVYNAADTSKIYVSEDGPVYYHAEYHIHLTEVSENKTKVEIFTINPSISIGHKPFSQYIHMTPIEREVLPSTIEEYEILLKIGEILGVKDSMPKIKLP